MKLALALLAVAAAGCNQPLFENTISSTGAPATATGTTGSNATTTTGGAANGAGSGRPSATGSTTSGNGSNTDTTSSGTSSAGATTITGAAGATGGTGTYEIAFFGQRIPAEVVFIVDRSGSMADAMSSSSQESKWADVEQALPSEVNLLAHSLASDGGGDSLTAMVTFSGATAASTSAQDLCHIGGLAMGITPLLVANDGSNDVAAADSADVALNATTPLGGTPTATALSISLHAFASEPADQIAVLITGSAPNCNPVWSGDPSACIDGTAGCVSPGACYNHNGDPEGSATPLGCADTDSAVNSVVGLAGQGVSTMVIGVGSELQDASSAGYLALDAMGQAGGILEPSDGGAHFFQTEDLYSLEAALNQVGEVLQTRCTVVLAQAAPENFTSVQVGTELLPAADFTPSSDRMSMTIRSSVCGSLAVGVPALFAFYN